MVSQKHCSEPKNGFGGENGGWCIGDALIFPKCIIVKKYIKDRTKNKFSMQYVYIFLQWVSGEGVIHDHGYF